MFSGRWLVTGGAGYIGQHVVQDLLNNMIYTCVVDDLSTGRVQELPKTVPFLHSPLDDVGRIKKFVEYHDITGVIHMAGYKYASESLIRPVHTYEQNVTSMIRLLEAIRGTKVRRVIFSSSAAVYGTSELDKVTEKSEIHPESPYGVSKMMAELILEGCAPALGIEHTSLRYFNVAGTNRTTVDNSPYNLFPSVCRAILRGERPVIYGGDYPTRDGSCVRDYVHVRDVARAHLMAARASSDVLKPHYNLGSGNGYTVLEAVEEILTAAGSDLIPEIRDRREGDPASIVADSSLIREELEWSPLYSLRDMALSSWKGVALPRY